MSAAPATADSSDEVQAQGQTSSDKLKFATRTALSLTLAYLIPMALGWPQPQTAAITVMLIATTGALSESLQKGVMRTLGTVAGAVIGLSLIALFPQDRLLYLAAISIVVTVLLYLYNAYQSDSTVFMLTMVVTLMVFNGGDADGAFIYGIDRTLLTAFGVMTYSLVGSFLWPVKTADNLERLAAAVTTAYTRAGTALLRDVATEDQQEQETEVLALVLTSLEQFRTHYIATKYDANSVQAYQSEWNAILGCYEKLESIIVPALRFSGPVAPDYPRYISNHAAVVSNLEAMLDGLQAVWVEDEPGSEVGALKISYNDDLLQREKHLTVAAVISRGQLLEELQDLLRQLTGAVSSLRFDRGNFARDMDVHSTPAFIWFDRENLKTALRGFVTFWIATFIWIEFNPPGGFMFVTLCTALVPLVSYTPVTPKLLFFLFSFGFLFAIPAYVFLLPGLTHWLQLAVFLFCYAFFGFFAFPGPVAIFFLLGLFSLGIQNTMSYNFNVIALVMLMFYLVCALLIVSVHFPFTSKPNKLYLDFRRRFFHICGNIVRSGPPETLLGRTVNRIRLNSAAALINKMEQWGPMIDESYFPANAGKDIVAFNHSCENLLGRLSVLTGPNNHFSNNRPVLESRAGQPRGLAAALCDTLGAEDDPALLKRKFDDVQDGLRGVEAWLNEFLDPGDEEVSAGSSHQRYSRREMADFYRYINLQAAILVSMNQCRESLCALDWRQLGDTKF
jgi:hypothetical protein